MPPKKKSTSAKRARKRAKTAKRSTAGRGSNPTAGGRVARSESASSHSDPAVIAFLKDLDHPRKKELESVRQLILGVSPTICEGIKWNSPSFRTVDWFATINVHGKDGLRLILHAGAKVKDNTKRMQIADPAGLLQWLAKDRCLVTLGDGRDIQAKRIALRNIINEWIGQI